MLALTPARVRTVTRLLRRTSTLKARASFERVETLYCTLDPHVFTSYICVAVVEPSRVATVSILGGSSQWFEQGEPSELICTATGSSLVDRLEWVKVPSSVLK